jgi:hypothetical protein
MNHIESQKIGGDTQQGYFISFLTKIMGGYTGTYKGTQTQTDTQTAKVIS